MRRSVSAAGWLGGLGALLVGTVLWSATVGVANVTPVGIARIVLDELGLATYRPSGEHYRFIVLQLRLPRIVLGAAVGTALAAAGTVMQGFFRNPMADPSIVGVSSGAATGAVLFIVTPVTVPLGLPLAAFAGGIAAAFLVYLIATQGGRTPVATLLLAGVAVQSFLGAVVAFMLVRSGDHGLRRAYVWLLGSLGESAWHEAVLVTGVTVVGVLVLWVFSRDLNVLLLGEADAHALGVEVERTKRLLLAVASVLTGAAVMYAGIIGFVGLVVPHAMRLLVGPDHRLLLPASALAGGTFLVLADTLTRWGAAGLPVGVVTAFVGAPFFLYLLRSREVHAL